MKNSITEPPSAPVGVEDAPQRMVGDGISYGVSVAGTGIANGQSVRIVKEVG